MRCEPHSIYSVASLFTLDRLFKPYQEAIDETIKENIPCLGAESLLREACAYVLQSKGKRFRPALVLMMAEALGFNADVKKAALAIEYFHTASLIADDLPCMDDDDVRRDRPSVHKVYGEAVALLASYALMSKGYHLIAENARIIEGSGLPFALHSSEIGLRALEYATKAAGLEGAIGGQFYDLYPPQLDIETAIAIIHMKTTPFFEVSFIFGWLFGGGSLDLIHKIQSLSRHFGLAFQTADDFFDLRKDQEEGRKVNMFSLLGKEKATKKFYEELSAYHASLHSLGIQKGPLHDLGTLLEHRLKIAL
jgi:geranylgeranyl diphosphate synthase type II